MLWKSQGSIFGYTYRESGAFRSVEIIQRGTEFPGLCCNKANVTTCAPPFSTPGLDSTLTTRAVSSCLKSCAPAGGTLGTIASFHWGQASFKPTHSDENPWGYLTDLREENRLYLGRVWFWPWSFEKKYLGILCHSLTSEIWDPTPVYSQDSRRASVYSDGLGQIRHISFQLLDSICMFLKWQVYFIIIILQVLKIVSIPHTSP